MNAPLKPIDMATRWEYANLPRAHWGKRLADFRPYDPDSSSALQAANELVESFPERCQGTDDRAGRGLLLVGNPGTGKTMLAAITATEIHLRHRRNILFVKAARYIKAMASLPGLRRDAERGDGEAASKLVAVEYRAKLVRTRPYLVWDDAGKEHHTASDFAADEIDDLLRDRFHAGLVTTMTTNVRVKDWETVYNPSMFSFLHEAFELCGFSGPDQRRHSR